MFESVEREVFDRLKQSKNLLNIIDNLESKRDRLQSEDIKIQKGFLFVSLYSSLEFALVSTAGSFLECVRSSPKKPMEYNKYFLGCILNAEFNSIRDSSKKTVWDKKLRFLDSIFSENTVCIDTAVFPTDGINISYKQLQDIWKFFHLPGSELPDGVEHFLLNEVKDHRNAIAHGRKTASEVGARYTSTVLKEKEHDIALVCLHIIESFKDCYINNLYLKSEVT